MLLLATEEATRLNNSAALHLQRGNYAQAEELFHAALASLPANSESAVTAAIMTNLCELNRLNGHHAQAELWCERSIKLREKILGPEDPATANALNAMACIKQDLGQFDAAERLARRAVGIRERAGVTQDAHFAAMLHNLGKPYVSKRDWIGAETVLKRSRELRRALAGETSLDYSTSLQTLGALRHDQSRLDEAYDLYQQVLAIRVALLGPSHPLLGSVLTNLSLVCLGCWRFGRRQGFRRPGDRLMEEVRHHQSRLGTDEFGPHLYQGR